LRSFSAAHRGGSGEALVCLHGFMESWRTWELVLPALERVHEVLAPTLPGHAGGPSLNATVDDRLMADAVERVMDDAGLDTAHIAGNSLGGFVALQLAERGRARSVVALAPAGGSASHGEVLERQRELYDSVRATAAYADAIAATPEGRRAATELLTVEYEQIPAELVADLIAAVAVCDVGPLIDYAVRSEWPLDVARIDCPVRIVWGREDRLLPWPSAAERFRAAFPYAEWIELDDVGHAPQLDTPLVTAQLIAGFAAQFGWGSRRPRTAGPGNASPSRSRRPR
jgi:pimeloyl-ACP methyl ester carboxylesterase